MNVEVVLLKIIQQADYCQKC